MRWLTLLILLIPMAANAATWYVRPDGGTGYHAIDHPTGQCSGLVDAPYPGTGVNQPCAVKDHYQLIGGTTLVRHWNISGGDTVLFSPGNYTVGYKEEPEQKKWCGAVAKYGCEAARNIPGPPSGTPENPTRILGKGWDTGCTNPPVIKGDLSEFYVLSLDQTSNAEVQCLEITDDSPCKTNAHDPSVICNNTPGTAPYFGGQHYAWNGIYGANIHNLLMKNVNVHGVGNNGMMLAGVSDVTLDHVKIRANGFAGWNAAITGEGTLENYNYGNIVMRNVDISYNGCAEDPVTHQVQNCHAEYGDGLGTSATCGDWLIEDSKFNYNTSDGIDLLYVNPTGKLTTGKGIAANYADGTNICAALGYTASVTIRRTESIGNAGNAMKASGAALIENSIADASCLTYWNSPLYPYPDSSVYYCRAYGQAVAFSPRNRTNATIRNSYIGGNGDTMIIAGCGNGQSVDDCGPGTKITVKNNVIYPSGMWKAITGESALPEQGFFWADTYYETTGSFPFAYDFDYNVILPTYLMAQPSTLGGLGIHTVLSNPKFLTDPAGALGKNPTNYGLAAGSPAIGTALFSAAPADDFTKATRTNPTDIGPLMVASAYNGEPVAVVVPTIYTLLSGAISGTIH